MIEDKIQRNVSMAPFLTFKTGGSAKYFIDVKEQDDLAEVLKWARKNKIPFFILGGGSNLLVNDGEADVLFIKISNDELRVMENRMYLGAGASLSAAISIARRENLTGLEWGFGIPRATMGGCIRGNAGGFGYEMKDLVETVTAFNISKGVFTVLSNKDCKFGYRTSIFKQDKNLLVWDMTLRFNRGNTDDINAKLEKNMKFRDEKQPKLPNAGSIFKNLFFKDIQKKNKELADLLVENGKVRGEKVGSGALIEMLGLKGKVMGGAKISLEHANFIVNTGTATAQDVFKLMLYVKKEVKQRLNIDLEPEVQFIGFEKYENT